MSINEEQPKPLLINYILKIISLIIFIKYSHYILKNKEIIISDLNKGINNARYRRVIASVSQEKRCKVQTPVARSLIDCSIALSIFKVSTLLTSI